MSLLGTLSVKLDADTTSYLAGMSAAAKSAEQTVKHMRQMTGAATAAGAALTGIGSAIMAEAAKWSAPAAAATKQLKDSYSSLAVEVSTLLLPAMRGLADTVKTLADYVAGLTPAQKEMAATVAQWAAGLAAAAAALTIVLPLVQAFAAAAAALFGVLGAIGAPVLLALALVAVGLVVLHKAWRENWGGMQEKVKEVVENILRWLRTIPDAILDALAAVDKMAGRKVDVQLAVTGVADPKIAEENARMERNIDRETARLKAKGAMEALTDGASQLGDILTEPIKAFGAEVKLMGAEVAKWAKGLLPASKGKSGDFAAGAGGHKLGEIDLRQAEEIVSKAMAELASELVESSRKTWSTIGEAETKAAAEAAEMLGKAGGSMADAVRDAARAEADARAAAMNHWTLSATKADWEWRTTAQNATLAFGNAAMTIVSKMGSAGDVIGAGIEGFKTAGPWGAIIGILATLFSKTTAFQGLIEILNDTIGKLLEAINPLAQVIVELWVGMHPLADLVIALVKVVVAILTPILKLVKAFDFLSPLMEALFKVLWPVFNKLGEALTKFGEWINAIIRWFEDAMDTISVALGGKANNANARAAKAAAESAGTGTGKNRSPGLMSESTRHTAALGDTTNQLEGLGDAAQKTADRFNEMLTNMPSGYKIRASQFGADSAHPKAFGGGIGLSAADARALAGSMASAFASLPSPPSTPDPAFGGGSWDPGLEITSEAEAEMARLVQVYLDAFMAALAAGLSEAAARAAAAQARENAANAPSLRELAQAIANNTKTELKRSSRNGATKMRTG